MGTGGGFGMGRGGGRGTGHGRGTKMGGGGRGMGRGGGGCMGGIMAIGPQQQYPDAQASMPINREKEIAALKQQSEMRHGKMTEVNGRLRQFQSSTPGSNHVAFVAAERCVGCSRCVAACPNGAIRMDDTIARADQSVCTGCGQCVNVCPQNAVTLR